ncbi:hypothetical protein J8F10_34760 [Gemmata sp. G18]|uniref:DUF4352 domain-containing protein n=1 Tax=Gemmata palustris TaxID=2822762 RepID=A0ABS5C439_9BACT|nr:hypothetical protein [Gemmata palustris]MBP3960417.1 hypothetical protein [Gemmata palustris]
MPFFTRCPYCRCGADAPDSAMAENVKCQACLSWYTAIPEEPGLEGAAPPVDVRTRAAVPAWAVPEPVSAPTETAVAAEPLAAVAPAPGPTFRVAVNPEPSEETLGDKSGPVLIGVVACFLAAAGLATASFQSTAAFARPLAGVGVLVGLAGALASGAEKLSRLAVPIGGAGVSGLALVVAWFLPSLLGPGYEASRVTSDYDPEAIRAVPLQLVPGGAEELGPGGYADASRSALHQGLVGVQITGAAVAPVQVVDSKKRFTKQSFLAINVRIQHLGHGERFRFVHWDTTGARPVPAASATTDGRKLSAANMGPDVPVGVTFGYDVFPGKAVDDQLLFEAPDAVGPVRVELPAEAWGGRGALRFQIPSSMIVVQPGKKPR